MLQTQTPPARGARLHPGPEWFRKIIEAIDAALDSLIAAAGGVGGLVKEFKDALLALAPAK